MQGTMAGGGAAGGGAAGGGAVGGLCGSAAGCGAAVCGGGGGEEVEVMTYQGNCAGSYIQETTYKYVGTGAGDFEPVKVGGTNVYIFACGGVGFLFAGLLIFLLWPAAATTTTTTFAPKPSPSFDCNAGFKNWESSWTPAKKAYCCAHTGRGCPTTVAPTPPTAPPVVTTVAPSTPAPPPVTPAPPNECQMGSAADWAPKKKAYCCQHYGNGCPTVAPTPAPLPFDCNAGFENWQSSWSIAKKQWCCQHTGRGCPSTSGCTYDCNAGFEHWKSGWSLGKRVWCCKHTGRGCD